MSKECRNGKLLQGKPFLKWVGGKTQLLEEIRKYYPFDEKTTKYAEPFIGGGAVLFDILKTYDLESVYISDINPELINAYKVVRDNVEELIENLSILKKEYMEKDSEKRKEYYLVKRDEFNSMIFDKNCNFTTKASLLMFLNKTCYNGLFRVNQKGLYNVPAGVYKNPLICDTENLRNVSKLLQNVEIVCGDYKNSFDFIDEKTFVYFDPPYRPITETSAFTAYTKSGFSDKEQLELGEFIEKLTKKGAKIVLSNSDPKNNNREDNFFDDLYSNKIIKRVKASRMLNSNKLKRGRINEILVSNFEV